MDRLEARVLAELPHDPTAFTQGLLWHAGALYESTGQYGGSTVRRVDPETGAILEQVELAGELFGEGLALVDDRLIQLTWKAEKALVWALEDLEPLGDLSYAGEGWGLCHDGQALFMSDGTSRLSVRDPKSFAVLGTVEVSLSGRSVGGLNELECAEGWIYANVIGTDVIVRIDPSSGRIAALIDASGLLDATERSRADVLNGIAYRPDRGTFLLTGKFWPRIFEVVFSSPEGGSDAGQK